MAIVASAFALYLGRAFFVNLGFAVMLPARLQPRVRRLEGAFPRRGA